VFSAPHNVHRSRHFRAPPGNGSSGSRPNCFNTGSTSTSVSRRGFGTQYWQPGRPARTWIRRGSTWRPQRRQRHGHGRSRAPGYGVSGCSPAASITCSSATLNAPDLSALAGLGSKGRPLSETLRVTPPPNRRAPRPMLGRFLRQYLCVPPCEPFRFGEPLGFELLQVLLARLIHTSVDGAACQIVRSLLRYW